MRCGEQEKFAKPENFINKFSLMIEKIWREQMKFNPFKDFSYGDDDDSGDEDKDNDDGDEDDDFDAE